MSYPRSYFPMNSHLQQSPHELASNHFIANYINIPHRGYLATTVGYFEYVVPLLTANPPSLPFKYAFHACALASFHNTVGTSNRFDQESRRYYMKALATTIAALRSPVTAQQDGTLGAVLLLSHFEKITATSLNMLPWNSHVEGAIELIKRRGKKDLNSRVGLDLFIAVRAQMVWPSAFVHVFLITKSVPFQIIRSLNTANPPAVGVDWWIKHPGEGVCGWHFQQLIARVGMLKAEANSLLTTITRIPENVARVQELAAKCKGLDKEITTSLRDLPEGFGWETVAWVGRPRCSYPEIEAFPGPIHVYRDLWIANLWNVMRCMRLVLAALTIRYLAWTSSPADYRTTREYGITAMMSTTAINDVISSVPFHLGWFSRQNYIYGQFRHSYHRNGENDSEKCLAGYFLLYPLLCLQCQDFLTDAQCLG